MVYSRATTSAIALRWVLPEAFLVEDISATLLAAVQSREASRNCAEQAQLLAVAATSLEVYILTEIGCGLVDGEIEMRRESSRKPRSPGRFAICVRSLNPLAVLEKSGARKLYASASRTTNHQHQAN